MKRFVDLSADETSDLWLTAREVGGHLERYYGASSLTFAIQVILVDFNSHCTLYKLIMFNILCASIIIMCLDNLVRNLSISC